MFIQCLLEKQTKNKQNNNKKQTNKQTKKQQQTNKQQLAVILVSDFLFISNLTKVNVLDIITNLIKVNVLDIITIATEGTVFHQF